MLKAYKAVPCFSDRSRWRRLYMEWWYAYPTLHKAVDLVKQLNPIKMFLSCIFWFKLIKIASHTTKR